MVHIISMSCCMISQIYIQLIINISSAGFGEQWRLQCEIFGGVWFAIILSVQFLPVDVAVFSLCMHLM